MIIRTKVLLLLGILLLLSSITVTSAYLPNTPLDVPDVIITEATDYVLQSPKIYYINNPVCAPIREPETETAVSEAPAGMSRQVIGRTGIAGGEPREMYDFYYDLFCEPPDQPDILSDIVSDEDYVYFVSRVQGGLARVSEDRLIWQTDDPELISPHTPRAAELVMIDNNIYMLQTGYGTTGLYRINKTTGASTQLLTGPQLGTTPVTFQTDGQYLYWRYWTGSGWSLERYNIATSLHNTIATNMISYYPVAGNVVYIGFADVIRSYEHATGTLSAPLYTSDAASYIISITADGSALYFVQQPQGTSGTTLYRLTFGGTAVPLHVSSGYMYNLQRQDSYLYFLNDTVLQRIRTNAGTAPLTNLRIDGFEITQAIQSDSNNVPLVRGKRTAVRLFASSEGDAVSGVYARLYRIDGTGAIIDGPLLPINLDRSSTYLRIQPSPDRDNLNDSFTFFLPPNWTDDATLRLRAELNPYHFPPEPNYADNALTTSTFNLDVSRRLETHFVLFEYDSGGTRYRPRYVQDFLQTISWVRRAYPLASTPGWSTTSSPGFRPAYRYLYDADLGGNVDGTNRDPDCQRRIDLPPGSDGYLDDPTLCAAWYVICPSLDAIRAAEGLADTIFQVGMVPDDAGFPRGWACGRGVSTPSGMDSWGWDLDGSYADWYAGHEIGHSQGRGHTFTDPAYPWPDQQIGDDSYRGFDMGDTGLNSLLVPRVYPNEWHDVMSYSMPQWISDYTYVGIKNFTSRHVTSGVAAGPYLQLSGVLFPGANEADLTQVRLWDSLSFTPDAPVPGAYRIRLLNGSNSELALYDFTPVTGEDPSALLISEFVPFVAGAAHVEITHPATGDVVWRYDVSTNAPVVNDVHLVGAPSPVAGEVTVQWTATDADGDDLTYDVLYSDDDGATWQMIYMAQVTTSAIVDTASLAGSTQGRFKVIANDGLQQGEAVSAVFTMSTKAPLVTVISPADGATFAYGQEVYFTAEVYDVQDGDVGSIGWRDQTDFLLGSGTAFAQDNLLIGENVITVTATNSAGLSTAVAFTIYVEDELQPPDATLTVGPDQVGWHVDDGETVLQTATVVVSNAGDDSFTVTAIEDAPWLTVNLSGNTTPLQLTLTADPVYLTSGQVFSTNLEITGVSSTGTQTIIVPVSFAMGYISDPGGDGGTESYNLFLPAVLQP